MTQVTHRQPRRPRPWRHVDWIAVGEWAVLIAAPLIIAAVFVAFMGNGAGYPPLPR